MLFFPEYKNSYKGVSILGMATVPLKGVRSPYLRFCLCLIYIVITEVEESQSADVGFAEGDAPLPSDAVVFYI